MGINSTATAYNFGQMGSAFLSEDDNTVTCPEGTAIVAITFITDSEVNTLVSKDANLFPNTVGAAHDGGRYTRTVNQGNATTDKIIFDQENAGTGNEDEIKVGDEVYDGATGVLHGTVTALDPDGDNTKEIQISASVSITDNETLAFLRPDAINSQGVGGVTLTNGTTFAGGTTIYGRWDSVKLNDDASAAIVYFGY